MDAARFPTTKIQPPRSRAPRVERPTLDAAVTEALLDCRVVLLQAPAGFGKTSVLAAQLARMPAGTALAWVSMDEDDDPQRLFACLAAALEPHDLPWRTAPEALVSQLGDDAASMRRAVAELINALAGADAPRGVIVLDDLHRTPLPQTHGLLDALIERLPPKWTIVLSTRTSPPLALARLRVAGELAEFTQDDLRFSASEAAALADHEEAAQGRERVGELFERTQGWPAGLQLCLAALRTRPGLSGGLAGSAARMDRHLFEYLASEVLDDMPPALHDFLVRCAVLHELTAARAAAVSADGRAAEWLDEIERRGLFVTALEANERTLVLHDLFREALLERARRRFADELPALLQRAAAGETDPLRRVGYLLRAADWPGAEGVLAQAAPELFLQGGAGEVQRLVDQFPSEWRAGSARLSGLAGVVCCLRWQWVEMAHCMEQAVAASSGDDTPDGIGQRQLAQAYLATSLYPLGRNAESEALIAQLEAQPLAPHARAVALLADVSQRFRRGEHERVHGVYAELVNVLESHGPLFWWWECAPAPSWSTLPGMRPVLERYFAGALARLGDRALPMRGEVHIQRAFTRLWAGRIDDALAEARIAEADMKWLACSGEMQVSVSLFRMIEGAIHGRADAVMRMLNDLFVREDGAAEDRRRLWRHQMAVYGVRLNDVLGANADALHHWAAHLTERPLESDEAQTPRAMAMRARHAAAQERWPDAAALFESLLPHVARMDVMAQAVELQLRASHALLRCNRVADAARVAAPAIERIRGEGQRGHALMCGPAVLRALAGAQWGMALTPAQIAELEAAAALAASLRAAAPADARIDPAPASPPTDDSRLSAREREVLELIAAGDSNKVIARTLDISLHTVKRHVANILDKLGLASRGQASAWLRENA